jgi:hypothetical protein
MDCKYIMDLDYDNKVVMKDEEQAGLARNFLRIIGGMYDPKWSIEAGLKKVESIGMRNWFDGDEIGKTPPKMTRAEFEDMCQTVLRMLYNKVVEDRKEERAMASLKLSEVDALKEE